MSDGAKNPETGSTGESPVSDRRIPVDRWPFLLSTSLHRAHCRATYLHMHSLLHPTFLRPIGNPQTGEAHEIAPQDAHKRTDSKDQQSNANKIEDAKHVEKKEKEAEEEKAKAAEDPTAIARAHGNEPSRGAKKDKEIIDDEAEIIRKMDEAKEQSKAAKK